MTSSASVKSENHIPTKLATKFALARQQISSMRAIVDALEREIDEVELGAKSGTLTSSDAVSKLMLNLNTVKAKHEARRSGPSQAAFVVNFLKKLKGTAQGIISAMTDMELSRLRSNKKFNVGSAVVVDVNAAHVKMKHAFNAVLKLSEGRYVPTITHYNRLGTSEVFRLEPGAVAIVTDVTSSKTYVMIQIGETLATGWMDRACLSVISE
jgi:hypothetical protein